MEYNYGNTNSVPPQNGYIPAQNQQYSQIFVERVREKKAIRTIGTVTGICIIVYVVLQNVLTLPILFVKSLSEFYHSSSAFQDMVGVFLSILTLLIPFVIGGRYLSKRTCSDTLPLEKPYNSRNAFLLILAGFGACIAADYVSGWLTYLIELAGLKLTSPDITAPDGFLERSVYFISIAFIAPLAEEAAIRGAVMQPLRKYGDMFAIVMSAAVFGILHGNLIQAPFAFLAGLALGYAAVATGTLWTSIAIHMLNNIYACVSYFVSSDFTQGQYTSFYYYSTAIITVIGVLAAIGYVFIKDRHSAEKSRCINKAGSKAFSFFVNVPMIIALIIMLYITSFYVELK